MRAFRRADSRWGWRSLREFLKARGIDPSRAALAVLYPDDVRELVTVIVVSIDHMFEVEIDYPEGIDLAEANGAWGDRWLERRYGSDPP